MPVYDGAGYLPGAIASVLDQTFRDFELLLIDDASPDGSVEVARSYSDPRIRLLRNERNLGQVETVNRGLREARGEYVARLDQDDRCLPNRLERQVAVLDAEPSVAVVGSWVEVVDPAGRVVETLRGAVADLPELVFLALVHRIPIAHSAVMFRRDEVVALGGYDSSYALAEDQHLWRQLALRRREARVVPEVLLRYLVHEGQQSRQRYAEQLENSTRSLDVFVEALARRGPMPGVRRLLMSDPALYAEATRTELARVAEELDVLLEAAGRTLRLSPSEATKLDRLVRRHVVQGARRSWRSSPRALRRAAPPLLRFGLSGEPPGRRLAQLGAFAGVYAGAPLLPLLRSVGGRVRRAAL